MTDATQASDEPVRLLISFIPKRLIDYDGTRFFDDVADAVAGIGDAVYSTTRVILLNEIQYQVTLREQALSKLSPAERKALGV